MIKVNKGGPVQAIIHDLESSNHMSLYSSFCPIIFLACNSFVTNNKETNIQLTAARAFIMRCNYTSRRNQEGILQVIDRFHPQVNAMINHRLDREKLDVCKDNPQEVGFLSAIPKLHLSH